MTLYLRILRYLRPHAGVLAAAAAATLVFAALDAFSLVLIIPFLQALFGVPAGARAPGRSSRGSRTTSSSCARWSRASCPGS